jgi:Cu/Ag efflux protein CusF
VYLIPPAGSSEEPQNLAKLIVAAGWAAVKSLDASDGKVSACHDELVALENAAKAVKLAVHTDSAPARAAAVRKITWSPTSSEVEEIFNKHKGTPTPVVVVSRVGSTMEGDSVCVTLLTECHDIIRTIPLSYL